MKKVICIICTAALMCLTACAGAETKISAVFADISFVTEITCGDTKLVCDTAVDSDGSTVFTLVSPAELEGLSVSCRDGKSSVSFSDLSTDRGGGLCGLVYEAMSDAAGKNAVRVGDSFTVSGRAAGGYVLYVAPTGFPLSLVLEATNTSAEFSGLKVQKKG